MIESSPDGRVYEGHRGEHCKLEVNYLQLSVENLIPKTFHYNVEFEPKIPKKMLTRALDVFIKTYFSSVHFAFDESKICYTNQLLEVDGVALVHGEVFEKNVTAFLGDRSKKFTVKMKFATEVEMSVSERIKEIQKC